MLQFLFLPSIDGFNICTTIFIIFPAILQKAIIFCSLFRETRFTARGNFFYHSPFFSFVFTIFTLTSLPLPGVINIFIFPRLFRVCPSNFHKILVRGSAMQMAVNAFRLYIPFVRCVSVGGENERKGERDREGVKRGEKNRLRLTCGTCGQQYAIVVFYGVDPGAVA